MHRGRQFDPAVENFSFNSYAPDDIHTDVTARRNLLAIHGELQAVKNATNGKSDAINDIFKCGDIRSPNVEFPQ